MTGQTEQMRAAFEAWMSDDGQWIKAVERRGDGYKLAQTDSSWLAWKAAWQAATAAEQAGVPEGWRQLAIAIEADRTEPEFRRKHARELLAAAPSPPAAEPVSLCRELQQRCVDMGVYWRAPDAHGVNLSVEQAADLLRDALGVEVEIATDTQRPIVDAPKDGTMILAPLPGSDVWHAIYFGDRQRNDPPNQKGAICWRMGWDHRVIPDHDTPKVWRPQPPTTGEAK